MPSLKVTSQFEKIQNFKADYTLAEFTQYESKRTGMRVCVVDRKGPKVSLPYVYNSFSDTLVVHCGNHPGYSL